MQQPRNSIPITSPALVEKLYNEYHRIVFAACLKVARNIEEAEDAASRVWINVMNKFGQYRGDAQVSSFLYRIAVNEVLMHFRKKSTRTETGTFSGELPETTCDRNDDDQLALDEAISQLAKGYREIFVMHDVLGYGHREIGQLLNIDDGTSKSQLHKARQKLKQLLEKRVSG